jgi:hypothetical protein
MGQALVFPGYRFGLSRAVEGLRRVAHNAHPQLSSDEVINWVTARLLEQLERLKRDFAQGRLNLARATHALAANRLSAVSGSPAPALSTADCSKLRHALRRSAGWPRTESSSRGSAPGRFSARSRISHE